MTAPISFRWTRNRVLAAIALALGLGALAGNPVRGHTVTIDTQELASIVDGKVDHVTVSELADWIIRGAQDYRLVDIRSPGEFAAYHIPTAENVPLTRLPDFGLGRNEKVVLYCEGGIHSAQAWMLMRAQGYKGVYILFGGLDSWNDEVLHPLVPADSGSQARAAFAKAVQVAAWFGGRPRAASGVRTDTLAPAMPLTAPSPGIAAPKLPAGATTRPATGSRKREGC